MAKTMTLNEAARYLGFNSDSYVRRLVRAGHLPAAIVHGRYEIPASAVEGYRLRVMAKKSSAASRMEDEVTDPVERAAALFR